MTTPSSYMTTRFNIITTITSHPFTCDHLVHTNKPWSNMTPFKHDQPVHTTTAWFTCVHPFCMRPSRSHYHIPFTWHLDHPIHLATPWTPSPVNTWPGLYDTEKIKVFANMWHSLVTWKFKVRDLGFQAGVGEENLRPVFSNRLYITESSWKK